MTTTPATLDPDLAASAAADPAIVIVAGDGGASLRQTLYAGSHVLVGDEPLALGGTDAGPNPFQYLQLALGTCTSMTIGLYAKRKGWPLDKVVVRVAFRHVLPPEAEDGPVERFDREIALSGALDADQRERLLDIANKCPVHRTLSGRIEIETRLVP